MNVKRFSAFLGRQALILLGGILLGYALLVLVFLLPTEPMSENVKLSEVTFNGEWGAAEDSYHQLFKSYVPTQLDNTTDSLMLMSAIHDCEESVFKRAANVYYGSPQSYNVLRDGTMDQLPEEERFAYTRYWHGYMVTLKPLLLMFTYMDLRMINAILQGGLLVLIILGMQQRGLVSYLPAFLLSLLCLTPFVIPFSLQFSSVFYVMTVAMVALLYGPAKLMGTKAQVTFFLMVGMATSYFDFLTYPLATFGMPYCLCLLLTSEEEDRMLLKRLLLSALAWGIGYVGMWAGKWVIGAIFSGDPYWWYNIEAILVKRASRNNREIAFTFWDICMSVVSPFMKKPYLVVTFMACVAFVCSFVRTRKNAKSMYWQRVAAFVLLAISPLAWYFVTGNHSYIHAFYTSRALAVLVFAIGCLATRVCKRKDML